MGIRLRISAPVMADKLLLVYLKHTI